MKCKQCELIFTKKSLMKIHRWYDHRKPLKDRVYSFRLPWHEEEKGVIAHD